MDREEVTTKYAKGAKMEAKILFKDESYKIIGACFSRRATGKQLGLLINFGHYPKLEHERFVNQALSCRLCGA